jgi:hypothetical protein
VKHEPYGKVMAQQSIPQCFVVVDCAGPSPVRAAKMKGYYVRIDESQLTAARGICKDFRFFIS